MYLIRKHNLDVLDIPMADLTRQYMDYVEAMRTHQLELAAEYLLMAALLIEIKSRMLLPRPVLTQAGEEDPRAELVRRLLEYEQMKLGSASASTSCRSPVAISRWSRSGSIEKWKQRLPDVDPDDLRNAWLGLIARARMTAASPHHARTAFGARAHEQDPAQPAASALRALRRSV